MAYAVSALLSRASGQMQHVLWVLDAANADEAEAQAMAAALRAGTLVSVLVKPVSMACSPALALTQTP